MDIVKTIFEISLNFLAKRRFEITYASNLVKLTYAATEVRVIQPFEQPSPLVEVSFKSIQSKWIPLDDFRKSNRTRFVSNSVANIVRNTLLDRYSEKRFINS